MKPAIITALLATAAAGPAAAAAYIDSTSSFLTTGSASLYNGTGFNFAPLDFSKSVSVGRIVGGTFSGHYGAKVTASVGAQLKLKGSVSFSNTLTELSGGNLNTFAGNPFGPTSSAFYLTPTFSSSATTTLVGTGQVDASLKATVFAGANLHGKACLVFCKEGDLVNIGIGQPKPYDILEYHSATNSVTFLDQSYNDVLPKSFSSDTLPISAQLNAINVGGTATTKGAGGTFYETSQQIAGAYVDVAQAVVDAFGLTQAVLSGSVLGFDYTTVSAKVGAGINALYDVYTGVDRYVTYHFSSPVERYDPDTKKWYYNGTSVGLSGETTAILRPIGQISSLSILPEVSVYTSSTATLTLDATLEDHIKLLEVSGYGLSAGPLYQQNGSVTLGTIGTFSDTTSSLASTSLAPMTLDFVHPAGKSLAFAAASDAVPLDGSRSFVFVPDATATGSTDTVAGTIRLATNYGGRGCNADSVAACVFDRSFRPIAEQQRTTRDATGAPVITYATDFAAADAVQALPDGAFGTQSTPESMRALLAGLPGASGYTLPADIADNSTPFMPGIPEPASWAMMVAGFGLIGVMRRRSRTVAA